MIAMIIEKLSGLVKFLYGFKANVWKSLNDDTIATVETPYGGGDPFVVMQPNLDVTGYVRSMVPLLSIDISTSLGAENRGYILMTNTVAITVSLPLATDSSGVWYVIKQTGAAVTTLEAWAGDNIDGDTSVTLNQGDSLYIFCDGISWCKVGSSSDIPGVSDHGSLDGLNDDDHSQYLNETRHDVLDHTGLTGCGGLDETAHDLLDHTGLTGVPSITGLLNESTHDSLDHSGLTGIPSITGLLNEASHDALDHTGLTGVGISTSDHSSIDHTGLPGILQTAVGLSSYTHTQGSSSATWTVAHNLNDYPLVNVLDGSNNQMDYDVSYTDLNNLTISLASATTGTCKCYKGGPAIYSGDLTLYVDVAVSSSGDGRSWGGAYKTIAEATAVLANYAVIAGNVNVNIKTGTYAQPISLGNVTINGGLSFNADAGNVTLTGTSTVGTNATASINLYNLNCPYVCIGTDASHVIVCSPSTTGTAEHRASSIDSVAGSVWLYISVDATAWSSTAKQGVWALQSNNIKVIGSISQTTKAIYAYFSSDIYAQLSGSGNATVLYAAYGSRITKSSTFTITGTTAVTKSNGSQVINADGTLA